MATLAKLVKLLRVAKSEHEISFPSITLRHDGSGHFVAYAFTDNEEWFSFKSLNDEDVDEAFSLFVENETRRSTTVS